MDEKFLSEELQILEQMARSTMEAIAICFNSTPLSFLTDRLLLLNRRVANRKGKEDAIYYVLQFQEFSTKSIWVVFKEHGMHIFCKFPRIVDKGSCGKGNWIQKKDFSKATFPYQYSDPDAFKPEKVAFDIGFFLSTPMETWIDEITNQPGWLFDD